MMDRFEVKFKHFSTGKWYIALTAADLDGAYSEAESKGDGRSYKIIDTTTGIVLKRKVKKRCKRTEFIDFYWLNNRAKIVALNLKDTEEQTVGDSTVTQTDQKEDNHE